MYAPCFLFFVGSKHLLTSLEDVLEDAQNLSLTKFYHFPFQKARLEQ